MAETIEGPTVQAPADLGIAPAAALLIDPNGNGRPAWQDAPEAIQLAEEAITEVLGLVPGAGPVFKLLSFVAKTLPLIEPIVAASESK